MTWIFYRAHEIQPRVGGIAIHTIWIVIKIIIGKSPISRTIIAEILQCRYAGWHTGTENSALVAF